jgi:hypothetical protein
MSCPSGKRSYRNSVQAIEALMLLRYKRNGKRRHRYNRKERGAYKCHLCGFFHTTSQPGALIDIGDDDAA